jgi:putative ABC transport system permease protein
MIWAALRDLQWRKKRFAITLLTTSLVFAMSLVMSGLAASFEGETNRFLSFLGGTGFLATANATGPFYGSSYMPTSLAPGADPVMLIPTSLKAGNKLVQVSIIALPSNLVRERDVREGRPLAAPKEVVVDKSLGVALGSTIDVGGTVFNVVGRMEKHTIFAGQPTVIVSIEDGFALATGGQPLARTFVVRGNAPAPPGLAVFSRADAKDDLMRPLAGAIDAITFVKVLLWLVAACIVGSVVFLTALERTRDFAVFKATGVSNRAIGVGLVVQALIVALTASVIAIVLSLALAPAFPLPVEIPASSMVALPVVAVVIGLLASALGLRRTAKISPALAFGGP